MITLSEFDPVIVKIGFLEIRWYSLAYVLGIVLGWFLIKYLNKQKKVFEEKKVADDFFMYIVLGIVLGGRLGYVLFYNFSYFLIRPLEIFAVWQGGMSFHGGVFGGSIAIYYLCKKHKINFLKFMDLCAVVVPIGLFLGRIANFINMELYGRVTNVKWAVVFPFDKLARHPSQLYEAFFEGLVLFLILFYLAQATKIRDKQGLLSGLFLILYSVFRFGIEFFREPDFQLGFIIPYITMGQILTGPLMLLGIYLIINRNK